MNDSLAKRFFLAKESELLAFSKDKALGFFSVWTKKEASAKCLGITLSENLSKTEEKEEIFTSAFLIFYEKEQYVLTVACEIEENIEIIADEKIEINELSL